MSQAVEAVVGEGHAGSELGEDLEGKGPGAKGSSNAGTLDVPAEDGSDQVGKTEGVKGTGGGDTSDTVEGRTVPGDLRLVDGKVRRDGAGQTLLGQDLLRGLAVGHGLEGGASVADMCEFLHPKLSFLSQELNTFSESIHLWPGSRERERRATRAGGPPLLPGQLKVMNQWMRATHVGVPIAERVFEQALCLWFLFDRVLVVVVVVVVVGVSRRSKCQKQPQLSCTGHPGSALLPEG